jgi:hypothetical protein
MHLFEMSLNQMFQVQNEKENPIFFQDKSSKFLLKTFFAFITQHSKHNCTFF